MTYKTLSFASLRPATGAAVFRGSEYGAHASFFVNSRGSERHRHPYDEIFVLLNGEIDFTIDGESGHAAVIIIPAHTWHEFASTISGGVKLVNIHPVAQMQTEWAR
ncbi:cupin domain-containing protein [Arthrobacter sp.]|uniref:cupin domain-containing protein n=1 Tax=Arthrobacter sp. TaxID=1667 RepID=UPI003393951C